MQRKPGKDVREIEGREGMKKGVGGKAGKGGQRDLHL